jgi:XisH protein
MAQRDSIHNAVKQSLIKDGWVITDDPYVIAYGERFLFVDLGAEETGEAVSNFIGAARANLRIAVEIKELRGQSVIVELEQAIGQYVLYRLLLNQIEPDRSVYLAVPEKAYRELFTEPIGELVISDLPLQLLVIDVEQAEVKKWIPERPIEKSLKM